MGLSLQRVFILLVLMALLSTFVYGFAFVSERQLSNANVRATGMAVSANQQNASQTRAAANRLAADSIAQLALSNFGTNPDLSIKLATAATWLAWQDEETLSPLAQDALWQVLGSSSHTTLTAVNTILSSADGHWLATVNGQQEAAVYELAQGAGPETAVALPTDGKRVVQLQFSPDSRWLVAVTLDSWLHVWDLEADSAPQATQPISHPRFMRAFVFDPTNRWLATGSDDGKVRLIDLHKLAAATAPAWREFPPAPSSFDSITHLAFNPTGRWLATAVANGQNSQIVLWRLDAEDPNLHPVPLATIAGPIVHLEFTANDDWLLATNAEQQLHTWHLAPAVLKRIACQQTGGPTPEEWARHISPGLPYTEVCAGIE